MDVEPGSPDALSVDDKLAKKVVFLRDEMANMCWAVERIVASAAGLGVDGETLAAMASPAAAPPAVPGASARYRLGTEAPPHWRRSFPRGRRAAIATSACSAHACRSGALTRSALSSSGPGWRSRHTSSTRKKCPEPAAS
jgi:hypothetical protein